MAAGNLYYNRDQWTRNVGDEIPMLLKEDFFEYLLPNVEDQEVKTTMRKLMLQDPGVLLSQEASKALASRWTGITTRPSVDAENENDVFSPLKGIIESIKKCKGDATFTEFMMRPNHSLDSETDFNATFKPDGYDVLKEGRIGKKIHESHITWLLELKKKNDAEAIYKVSHVCYLIAHRADCNRLAELFAAHRCCITRTMGQSMSSIHVWCDHRGYPNEDLVLFSFRRRNL